MRRALLIAFAFTLGALVSGCGEAGVSSGATVTAYVSGEELCKGARRELNGRAGRAGSFRVRMVCLKDPGTLASTGANARRATEDSTTVGYITAPSPRLTSFSRAILDAAGIAQLSTSSGATAMARLLRAIRQASTSGRLREAVFDELR